MHPTRVGPCFVCQLATSWHTEDERRLVFFLSFSLQDKSFLFSFKRMTWLVAPDWRLGRVCRSMHGIILGKEKHIQNILFVFYSILFSFPFKRNERRERMLINEGEVGVGIIFLSFFPTREIFPFFVMMNFFPFVEWHDWQGKDVIDWGGDYRSTTWLAGGEYFRKGEVQIAVRKKWKGQVGRTVFNGEGRKKINLSSLVVLGPSFSPVKWALCKG